ncbi:MAG: diaminopimelate epimerase [Bacteroidota bacterium]
MNFNKYQSTGNDFILIDNRNLNFPSDNQSMINKLCDRRFGIGADGLILIQNSKTTDFKMVYFNADGSEGSFCGNGSRAAVHYANSLGMFDNTCSFEAYDGLHEASVSGKIISVKMKNVQNGSSKLNGTFIDTGSPHYVEYVESVDKIDMITQGRTLRYDNEFSPNGTNINFVERLHDNSVKVRTYERGVENETLSCGTGVTACALTSSQLEGKNIVTIVTKGGELTVSFDQNKGKFSNIWLKGPTEMVFKGEIDL